MNLLKKIRDGGCFGYSWSHLLLRPWKIPSLAYRRVKWFCQRGWRGYSDQDNWSIDHYILSWLPEAVDRLENLGHPHDLKWEEWQEIKKKMVVGLKRARAAANWDVPREEIEKAMADGEEGLDLFRKYFWDLWD